MIVAIHQPNFFPWLGYFAKISKADVFIFLDSVQFPKHSWVNRVKIKAPQGSQWLTVPVRTRGRFGQRVADVETVHDQDWLGKVLRTLQNNYSGCEHFDAHFPLLRETMDSLDRRKLCTFNIGLIHFFCELLGLQAQFVRSSELDGQGSGTDLLVSLIQCVGGDIYLSGDGAESYQEDFKLTNAGIRQIRNNFRHPQYQQLWGDFEPGLSILDAFFNVGKEGVQALVESG